MDYNTYDNYFRFVSYCSGFVSILLWFSKIGKLNHVTKSTRSNVKFLKSSGFRTAKDKIKNAWTSYRDEVLGSAMKPFGEKLFTAFAALGTNKISVGATQFYVE